ncbi:MAG: trimethylamine methyltransferase family protein [Proteobacteria bacterium]|nr:trimethylamine methyltransferase family protein [Pseudomonadota bacterium]MBT5190315.1 trimethylamine methyltransferase family protein [Pseudomonadota bacterium]MBT5624333.1 trimethylamine methyltransferase family protein [Pseudomonadota bacterium]MBT6070874.1 trimethylamine methyltransferase family protein [Pseudomonadota bacterium]MBT6931562.1 trimethylamine methyltransferase family protein [Pseudomonadota bacterium]
MTETKRRQRGNARADRRAKRERSTRASVPFITRRVPTFELASEEVLALIENNADTVLETIGIDFRDDPLALDLLKQAGASVEGERVRFPKGMCREIISSSAPAEFTQHARNPDRSVRIGGNHTVLVPAYGSPFVHDLDKGRRYATLSDFENFTRLAYMSPSLHHSGGTLCEPVDLPVNKRHLDMIYSHLRWSDKPFMGSVTHPDRAQDTVDMAKIAFGDDFLDTHCAITSLINANSPMTFDATMLGAARVYAENNQATVISPFILSGAMSPVTIVGTCTQILAEALAGICFTQLTRKGAPVIFGTFSSAVSMQSGAPTFGTPEPSMVIFICAALARRLGVPFRSGGGLCGSKLPDAQAAYEAANTLQSAMLAGVNFMLHTAGWLEGGLAMGYEKFILDADQAGMIEVFLSGVDASENGQAMDALATVGPGNHFLGCEHTQANFETAFYRSTTADNNSFEQWQSEGALDAAQRANITWKKMLDEYEAPPIDEGMDEALREFVMTKKNAVPDSNI